MNKTKLVLLLAASLMTITTAADAARPRGKPVFKRPAAVQKRPALPAVTNPVPARQAAPAAPAPKSAPAQTAAQPGAQSAAPAAAPAAQPAASSTGSFASNMMGAAVGAVAGSMLADSLGLGGEKPAETAPADAASQPAAPAAPAAAPADVQPAPQASGEHIL